MSVPDLSSIASIVSTFVDSIDNGTFLDTNLLKDTENGISLLALKNDALLSYISNLLLVAAAQLEHNEEVFDEARKQTIEQRVTLEKGIKGLEAKISYQIDKALRANKRFEEQKAADKHAEEVQAGSDSDMDDPTSFRPNVSSMKARNTGNDDSDSGLDDDDKKRYVVPKISSNAPAFEKEKAKRYNSGRRDFAMEEYIRETGEAPMAEPSIGSQIMDSGRGGERTSRDRKKAEEVRAYEEANYTRISQVSAKRARKEAAQRQRDATTKSFFGEDWSFLDSEEKRGGKKRKTKR